MEVSPIVHNLMGIFGKPHPGGLARIVAPCAAMPTNGLRVGLHVLRASEPALGASLQARGLPVIAS